jgi:hypothetical protein
MDNFIVLVVISLAVPIILFLLSKLKMQEDRAFEDKFPPITDDEFLARCTPGTNPKIALRVRRIVSESLGVDYDRIHPSSSFVDDLGAC